MKSGVISVMCLLRYEMFLFFLIIERIICLLSILIDKKPFDKVKHNNLIEILFNVRLNKRDIPVIRSLILSRGVTYNAVVVEGCIISPLLYNIYMNNFF